MYCTIYGDSTVVPAGAFVHHALPTGGVAGGWQHRLRPPPPTCILRRCSRLRRCSVPLSSFYSFDVGPVHVVVLNPYTATGENSEQRAWLQKVNVKLSFAEKPLTLPFFSLDTLPTWLRESACVFAPGIP